MTATQAAADVKPVLKYAGAKWRLADWIIEHFPQHEIYLEPFFGSGAVFFRKAPARLETINDIDGSVVNLFRVLREQPEQLAAMIELTPWARDEYYSSYEKTGDPCAVLAGFRNNDRGADRLAAQRNRTFPRYAAAMVRHSGQDFGGGAQAERRANRKYGRGTADKKV